MRIRTLTASLVSAGVLTLLGGCEDEPQQVARPKIKTREVIGKYTQDVRPAEPELQKGGAQPAPGQIVVKDPITLSGNVYVLAVDRIAEGNVRHALDLYNAEHGAYPRDFQEFMNEIIKPGKPDGIRLPQLPYYQGYSYSAAEHKLIVLEYPSRKAQYQQQQDKALGRQ